MYLLRELGTDLGQFLKIFCPLKLIAPTEIIHILPSFYVQRRPQPTLESVRQKFVVKGYCDQSKYNNPRRTAFLVAFSPNTVYGVHQSHFLSAANDTPIRCSKIKLSLMHMVD